MANLRLLPLIAVAVGGVIAVRAVGSIEAVPAFMKSATAWAEGAEKTKPEPKKDTKKAEAKAVGDEGATEEAADAGSASADNALSVLDMASPAVAKAAPVCATSVEDLAKQAGMSPSELQVLQSLAQRRAELDAREKQIATQEQLIATAEAKLDGRIKQLTDLKGQVQALLDEASKTGDQDVLRMVKVYESMKPKDAAKVFETLKDDVRLPIAAKMKERNLAAILAQMTPDKARDLTEKLAMRMKKADDLQNKLDKATAPSAANQAANAPKPGANAQTPPKK